VGNLKHSNKNNQTMADQNGINIDFINKRFFHFYKRDFDLNALNPEYIGLYTVAQIDKLIRVNGFIPVVSGAELHASKTTTAQTMGLGTQWEGTYTTGVDKKYIQLANISLSAYQAGAGWTPINVFSGTYEGNGFDITDLKIDTNANIHVGLFGELTGTVRNVFLLGMDISYTGTGAYYVGGISGLLTGGTISRCYITGAAFGYRFIGGCFGYNDGTDISNSFSSVNVSSTQTATGSVIGSFGGGTINDLLIINCVATGNVSFARSAGGAFIGSLGTDAVRLGTIRRCASFGSVTLISAFNSSYQQTAGFLATNNGFIYDCYTWSNCYSINNRNGGFVAINRQDITDCYSCGVVGSSGNINEGGFCGQNQGTITNSYWDTQTSGYATSDGGTGRTTAQMQGEPDAGIYVGWDTALWEFLPTNDYPYLKSIKKSWQR
jgi:hypothetical protein